MTKKVIDWDSLVVEKKPALKKGQYRSYKEAVQAKVQQTGNLQKSQKTFEEVEPKLKQKLFEYLVNKKPFTVLAPIKFHSDKVVKSEDVWGNTRSSFEFTVSTIQPGTTLEFMSVDKGMGTWIFKAMGPEGFEEVEIYPTPTITLPGSFGSQNVIRNSGFYGLLMNTSITKEVVEANEEA